MHTRKRRTEEWRMQFRRYLVVLEDEEKEKEKDEEVVSGGKNTVGRKKGKGI